MLLDTAPDFGYDSKLVIKWLETFGIPKTTARDNTKKLREEIDAKRDATILRLKESGETTRSIAAATGAAEGTVKNVIKQAGQNERPAKNAQEEHPATTIAEDNSTSDTSCPWFDDDECDTTPAINPADAFQKPLSEHEAERLPYIVGWAK